jgi:hypothetical protein
MTIQEQLKALRATLAAKAARIKAILQKSAEEGRSTDSAEAEEFDTLRVEIKQIEGDIERLEYAETLAVAEAVPVVRTVPAQQSTNVDAGQRGPTILTHQQEPTEKFKGQNYTRLVIAQAAVHIKGHAFTAAQYAEHRWGKAAANVVAILRAGVPGGGTLAGDWGAELVAIDTKYRGDFIEFLYSKTIFDQLPLRQVPANVLIKGQDGQGTGYWVGEKKAIPMTALDFFDVTLTPLKVGALTAISNELILNSDPSAEQLVRDGLVNASAQRVDTTFLSAAAAVGSVSPAGILNGVAALTAGGEDAQSLRDDISRLYAGFITAKNATGLVWVMHTGLAKSISLMRNALDQITFPGLSVNGGTFEGDTAYTGDNVASDDLILLKPSDIYRIGDTGVEVSVSKEATIEQNTAPTGDGTPPTAASANLISMFQEEMTAFKVVRRINFAKRRTGVVAYVGNATYGGSAT